MPAKGTRFSLPWPLVFPFLLLMSGSEAEAETPVCRASLLHPHPRCHLRDHALHPISCMFN